MIKNLDIWPHKSRLHFCESIELTAGNYISGVLYLLSLTVSQSCLSLILCVASSSSTLKVGVTEKRGACMKLRDKLEALEKESAAKLALVDQYNKDVQVGMKEWHPL